MQFSKGMRDKLNNYVDYNREFTIEMSTTGDSVYDFCCFGVDSSGKLSNDRYMVFYNQTFTPNQEIKFSSGNDNAIFTVNLTKLPSNIQKLVFTTNIDGNGTMKDIRRHTFILKQDNTAKIELTMSGSDFNSEKAIISVEIYQKDVWRIAAVANGFNGGLSALLANFGGTEVSNDLAFQPAQISQTNIPSTGSTSESRLKPEEELAQELIGKISLEKDKVNLEKHVVSLSKCVVNLSKKSGVDLGSTRAKVVVVLDYSGSMDMLYSDGTVQKTITKLVPLGLTFDDNGSIDVYLFQSNYRKMEDLNLSNYENYINNVVNRSGYSMGGTNYAPVLKAIIEGATHQEGGFLGFGGKTVIDEPIVDNGEPTFILFITDGENADRTESSNIIRRSSEKNVFIQFIGIGKQQFQYLAQLDDMPGRKRDNTGFSKMEDLNKASDEELYTNVLGQFSDWLKGLQ